jgi:hypothetical protein
MSFDKRFHRLFPSDLATATVYYDKISVDLGDRLRDSVRDKIRTIVDRPESFGFVRPPIRAAMIGGFPYLILFIVEGTTVFLAGLYHASSDPDRWLDRNPIDG